MTTIFVPYHQDQQLPLDIVPLPGGRTTTVDADLPEGDVWHRLTALYEMVAEHVSAGITSAGTTAAGITSAGTTAAGTTAAGVTTVVSGDCLVALASMAGAQRAGHDPAVVWFDAHGDVHTLQSSTSGYLGGLALRLLLGAHPERLAEPLGLRPLPEERAVLVDARDLDPGEVDYLSGSAVRREAVADLDAARLPDGPLLLHVDVDVIDAAEVPGLLFPTSDGPSTDAVVAAVGRVLATGRVVVADLAFPWLPATDDEQRRRRADVAGALLRAARG